MIVKRLFQVLSVKKAIQVISLVVLLLLILFRSGIKLDNLSNEMLLLTLLRLLLVGLIRADSLGHLVQFLEKLVLILL